MRGIIIVAALGVLSANSLAVELDLASRQERLNAEWLKVDERLRRELRKEAVRRWETKKERDWGQQWQHPVAGQGIREQGIEWKLEKKGAGGWEFEVRPSDPSRSFQPFDPHRPYRTPGPHRR